MADPHLGARWRHLASVLRGEARVSTAMREAYRVLLEYAVRTLASGGYDPSHLSGQAAGWTTIADQTVLPTVSAVFTDRISPEAAQVIDADTLAVRHLATVANRLTGVPDEVFDAMRTELATGRAAGESIPQLAGRVDAVLGDDQRWAGRATTIARTEVIGASNAGAHANAYGVAGSLGIPPEQVTKQWLATEDGRTRETHQAADGQQVTGLSAPFSVGGYDLSQPGDPNGPAEEVINCVVGSTQVAWPGQVVHAVTRRPYRGEFIKIRTARGHELTVTPNHPVLTPAGYVPAQALRPGEHVLATLTPPAPEVQDGPPSIEQVHRAALQGGTTRRVGGRAVDFHGDGTEAEVEVVRPHRDLTLDRDAELIGQGLESLLVRLGDGQGALPLSRRAQRRAKAARLRDGRRDSRAAGLVRGLSASTALDGGGAPSSQAVGLATRPDGQAGLGETANDQRAADAELARHLEDALALGMTPCEVVRVDRYTGTHDVFNLQTSDAWYIGAGIAQHNCRCTVLFHYPDAVAAPAAGTGTTGADGPLADVTSLPVPAPVVPAAIAAGVAAAVVDGGPSTAEEAAARTMTPADLMSDTQTSTGRVPKRVARAELRRRGLAASATQEDQMATDPNTDDDQTGVVVVAVPAANDPSTSIGDGGGDGVHCTLLYFGDDPTTDGSDPNAQLTPDFADVLAAACQTVAAAQTDPTVTDTVTGVDTLGPQGARVWMLAGDPMSALRSALIAADPSVQAALDAVDQFPTYTPHVTIGYPDDPTATALDQDTEDAAAAVSSITFDRLSVWWGGVQTDYPLAASAPAAPSTVAASGGRAAARSFSAVVRARASMVAALTDPCTCCGGAGEHFAGECGHECYVCDASGSLAAQAEGSSAAMVEPGAPIVCAGHHGTTDEGPDAQDAPHSDLNSPDQAPDGTPTAPTDDEQEAAVDAVTAAAGDPAPAATPNQQMDAGDPAPPELPEATADDQFYGVMVVEDSQTGDGRVFAPGSIMWDGVPLPMPLGWQVQDAMGHDGSVICGRVDTITRYGNLIGYTGTWDLGGAGYETQRLVAGQFLTGLSVDTDDFDADVVDAQGNPVDPMGAMFGEPDEDAVLLVRRARVRSAAMCRVPAFTEAWIANGAPPAGWAGERPGAAVAAPADGEQDTAPEDVPAGQPGEQAVTAALVAAAARAGNPPALLPPAAHFANPQLTGPTPITVDDDGRVFGHVATWGTCHVGVEGTCVTPPLSMSGYAHFLTGEVRTDAGRVPVGQVTMATGHAAGNLGHRPAVAHYDDTGTAFADVAAGEDEHGIWIAGHVRDGVTPAQVDTVRAAGAVSGDWRRIGAEMELVAALVVNVPGFPIPRLSVAASAAPDGEQVQTALVAAGMVAPAPQTPARRPDVAVGTPEHIARLAVQAIDRRDRARAASARLDARRAERAGAALDRLAANRATRAAAALARLNRKD